MSRGKAAPVDERNDRICKMYASGVNLREVGSAFGLSHEAVRLILLKRDVAIRARGRHYSPRTDRKAVPQ